MRADVGLRFRASSAVFPAGHHKKLTQAKRRIADMKGRDYAVANSMSCLWKTFFVLKHQGTLNCSGGRFIGLRFRASSAINPASKELSVLFERCRSEENGLK